MNPLKKAHLTFEEIADHWPKKRYPPSAKKKPINLLLRAFWEGHFEGHVTMREEGKKFGRKMALEALTGHFTESKIKFLTRAEDDADPEIDERDDGGVSVDLAARVIVPSADEKWTPELEFAAYEVLAKNCTFNDFDGDTRIFLKWIMIDHTSFRNWMKNNKWKWKWWRPTPGEGAPGRHSQKLQFQEGSEMPREGDGLNGCLDANSAENTYKTPTDSNQASTFDPLPLSGIARMFKLDVDTAVNSVIWKKYAEFASRNGLETYRISRGAGHSQSTFDPEGVGEWLVKQIRGLPQADVNRILANNLPNRSKDKKEYYLL